MTEDARQTTTPNPQPLRVLTLCGFMGSGKSTVGRTLAELMGWEFVDLDEEIERQEGTSIREIFAGRGEAEFRKVEHSVLTKLVASAWTRTVFALGGGTQAQPHNEELLKRAGMQTVFLEVPLEIMLRRCCSSEEQNHMRPLAGDPAEFRRLYEARLPSYRRADITMEAGDQSALEVARLIGAALSLVFVNDR
jgi:shikimate kinase